MKCEKCGIRDAVISYIDEKDDQKVIIHVCEECFLKQKDKEELKCDVCGMTYRNFLATGNWNCSNCYRLFKLQTVKILETKIVQKNKKEITSNCKEKSFKMRKSKSKKELLKELQELLMLAEIENDTNKIEIIKNEIKKIEELEIEK